jgi:hypothetical protein
MPRIVLSHATWQAVAHEPTAALAAMAPPGSAERLYALLAQAPAGWPEQQWARDLDESNAEAVQLIHAALVHHDPGTAQRRASVAEADQIIRQHQPSVGGGAHWAITTVESEALRYSESWFTIIGI